MAKLARPGNLEKRKIVAACILSMLYNVSFKNQLQFLMYRKKGFSCSCRKSIPVIIYAFCVTVSQAFQPYEPRFLIPPVFLLSNFMIYHIQPALVCKI